jgi:hypothetical protein
MVMVALDTTMAATGMAGYHTWEVTIGELTRHALQASFVRDIIAGPIYWLVKLCLFSLIMRAFNPVTWLRRLAILGIIVTGIFYTFSAVYGGIICRPRGGFSKAAYLNGRASNSCQHDKVVSFSNLPFGSFNVVSDFYILLIPIPVIVRLRLPLKKKLGILLICLTGLDACIVSVASLYYRATSYKTKDPMYDVVVLVTMNTVEISVGMIIPTLPSVAKVSRLGLQRSRSYFDAKYGWSFLRDHSTDEATDSEMKKYPSKALPNCRTHEQSDTIDRMMYGVHIQGVQREDMEYVLEHKRSDPFPTS